MRFLTELVEKLPQSITVVESALRARVPVLRLRYYDMQVAAGAGRGEHRGFWRRWPNNHRGKSVSIRAVVLRGARMSHCIVHSDILEEDIITSDS